MFNNIKHPTQLWIGDPQTLNNKITLYLQKKLCKNETCQTCVTCVQIANKEHPWVIWTNPERSYTLEQIDKIISMSSFKLDTNEQRFFILPEAERLTDQCSNRLLKTIEEPFVGYNFFFLAARVQALPLTIQSRCVVQKFQSQTNLEIYKEFLQPFLTSKFTDPINFIKKIETLDIKEQETKELTDALFEHWSLNIKNEIQSQNSIPPVTQNMIKVFQKAMNNPPMTGSSKIFWKNLYITAHNATKTP